MGLCCLLLHHPTAKAFTTNDLAYIGMPVGGIATGQVYLGGDGQLWNWDIFNIAACQPGGTGDRYYLNPMRQQQHFANGFAIMVNDQGKVYNRQLNSKGFSDITFSGEYPVGKVTFTDRQVPVEVRLQAYSPFIPTDADNSGLPAILMEYEVKNTSDNDLDIEMSGWLQNMSCFQTATGNSPYVHTNTVCHHEKFTGVVLSGPQELANERPDWGSMSLVLLSPKAVASARCEELRGTGIFDISEVHEKAEQALGHPLIGGVKQGLRLKKGESHHFTFLLTYHFPNVHLWDAAPEWQDKNHLRHYYNNQFKDALAVTRYVADHPQLLATTHLWNKTWYDSTLPKDFLDRTFGTVSTLATSATVRFDDITDAPANEGRYYNFEGVYLGDGTCRHVSHYGQVLGRLFPSLARHLRQQTDLGLSFTPEGIISYRGEFSWEGHHDGRGYAADGQAGTILGIYREHLMSPDNDFLKNNWAKVKRAMQYMIQHDKEKSGKPDGILEGIQYNTLDRMWYGKIPWISGLYIAALRASAQMAVVMGDKAFSRQCDDIAEQGTRYLSTHLFNGEYFVQQLDTAHLDGPNSNQGCHVDQLLGQYWASQLHLGHIFPQQQTRQALAAIMKYNFVHHYGDYLRHAPIPVSRWYADDDEQGVVGCTFPHGGADIAPGHINNDWEKLVVGYFSEIFTGQEHALAATLLSEGMVDDALKVVRAVNDRYAPAKRNPYNEIEYGNHYTRAMSSYAPFIAATGFLYDGPRGIIGFRPAMQQAHFKSAFVTAQGWGSYEQQLGTPESYTLQLHYGTLRLQTMHLPTALKKVRHCTVSLNGTALKGKLKKAADGTYAIHFAPITLQSGDQLSIHLSGAPQ